MLPSSGVDYKTPIEVWIGSHASYDSLHIFGCLPYYHIREYKIDPRARKVIFIDSRSGVKGYKLWCLQDRKMIVSRDVTFDEASLFKVPTGENAKALDESEKSKAVQTEVTTPVVTIPVQLEVTAPVDSSESDSENVKIPIDGV